jgi:hypothetical protein
MSAEPELAGTTVHAVIEGDALAVGRPGERANRERTAREGARRTSREVEDEQVRHPVVLLDDLKLAELLLAILERRRFGFGRCVGDRLAVRGPREVADAFVQARERFRFAAERVDNVELAACPCDPK